MSHKPFEEYWMEGSSISARGRVDHRSTYFFCFLNKFGRRKFVRNVPLNKPNDYDNRLMETIGSVWNCHTDSEIQQSAVYELLRANATVIHQSSLPRHGTLARRKIHHERGCQTYISIRSGKRRRRDEHALA